MGLFTCRVIVQTTKIPCYRKVTVSTVRVLPTTVTFGFSLSSFALPFVVDVSSGGVCDGGMLELADVFFVDFSIKIVTWVFSTS